MDGRTKHAKSLALLEEKRHRLALERERKASKISSQESEIEWIDAALAEIDASIARLISDPDPVEEKKGGPDA